MSKFFLSLAALFLVIILLWPSGQISTSELVEKWGHTKQFSLVELSDGTTHYQIVNGEQAPVVVFIHGVSGPMTAWDHTFDFLRSSDFALLRYDLFGRGFSDRLDKDYSLDLYVKQVVDLLKKFVSHKKIILVGSSFGCVISAAYASRHSERVLGLILIGPAGFPIEVPPLARLRDVPILGDILFKFIGENVILQQNEKYFVDAAAWKAYRPYFEDQLAVEDTKEAMLSTMRFSPVQSFVRGYRKLGMSGVIVKAIWGREDMTFPYSNHQVLQSAIPHLQLVTVENSAHLPQFERPVSVNPIILKLIRELAESSATR